MKNLLAIPAVLLLLLTFTACQDDESGDAERAFAADTLSGEMGRPPGNGSDNGDLEGLITAGEWNDLENWDYWLNLVNDTNYTAAIFDWGWNPIDAPGPVPPANANGQPYQIAFVVDATGSMGDELEYLKADLETVIDKVETENPNFQIETGAVFYRDVNDDYLTLHSPFSTNIDVTTAFIGEQSAEGGGDFPEAVHSGLEVALDELGWLENAGSKLTFLILDAPPHSEEEVKQRYQSVVRRYAAAGIRIVPVTASGIDRATEFLMRMTAIRTHGTYVFITDDSGIGNDHLEPTVGDYEVEFLGDLLVRLINEYGGE